MYEGYPYYVPAMWKWLPKFLRSKKKGDGVPPAHQLLCDLRNIYRLPSDGPRISHAEPSFKVGSTAYVLRGSYGTGFLREGVTAALVPNQQ